MNKLLIWDLIKLSDMSLRAVAKAAALDPSNLSGWLNDRKSYISDDGVERLKKVLGVDESKLSGKLVHQFRTDRNLEPLQRVITRLMGFTQIYPVQREKGSLFKTIKEGPLAILVGEKDVIATVRLTPKFIKEMHRFSNLPYVSPEYLEDCEWGIPDKNESDENQCEVISLSDDDFDKILNGNTKPEEVLELLAGRHQLTWTDVIETAKKKGLSPAQVVSLIRLKEK